LRSVEVISEIIINLPVDKVSGYSSNPDNAPYWYENIKSVEWKTAKLLRTGSQFAFTAHFLGRKLAYVYEITEFKLNKKLVMRTSSGPFPMETTYFWKALDEHNTYMSLQNRGIPSGFSFLFTPFIKIAMKRANKKDLELLRKILESVN